MNWEPRALHNNPTANEHSKAMFTSIILSQKHFLQGPNCTHIQALIVLSRTYPASDKNKNTIRLMCSVCCISHAGQAALNASVLGLSQVTGWMLPALAKPPLGAVSDTAAVVLRQVTLGNTCCIQSACLWWFFWTSQGISISPLCRLVLFCTSEAAASAVNLCLLWKNTLTGQEFSLIAVVAHLR